MEQSVGSCFNRLRRGSLDLDPHKLSDPTPEFYAEECSHLLRVRTISSNFHRTVEEGAPALAIIISARKRDSVREHELCRPVQGSVEYRPSRLVSYFSAGEIAPWKKAVGCGAKRTSVGLSSGYPLFTLSIARDRKTGFLVCITPHWRRSLGHRQHLACFSRLGNHLEGLRTFPENPFYLLALIIVLFASAVFSPVWRGGAFFPRLIFPRFTLPGF